MSKQRFDLEELKVLAKVYTERDVLPLTEEEIIAINGFVNYLEHYTEDTEINELLTKLAEIVRLEPYDLDELRADISSMSNCEQVIFLRVLISRETRRAERRNRMLKL